jgi:pimeloyl-ACP methyl ester carboxylesterase
MKAPKSVWSEKERVSAGGYTIDVCQAGSVRATTIVLVHGIGVSSRYFLPLATTLARDYHVVLIDLPGYGQTPDPDHVLSLPELAGVVGEYIRTHCSAPVVVIGHSMGCQIVAHLAEQEPATCSKLILLGPTVTKWERRRLVQAWRLTQDIMQEPVRASMTIFFDYLRMGVVRYMKTSRYMIEDRIDDTLAACQLPVLLVRGTRDSIVSIKWLNYLASQLPRAKVREIPDAPHAVQVKQAKRLARLVREFIRE